MTDVKLLYLTITDIWRKKGVNTEKSIVREMMWENLQEMIEEGYSRKEIIDYYKEHKPNMSCYY